MVVDPQLIVQVAQGSEVERRLSQRKRNEKLRHEIVVEAGPADEVGNLEPPAAGQVVLSVPSPETLAREPEVVRRVIRHAGDGVEPLVVVVDAAEELRDEELSSVLAAAGETTRAVILRVIRDG